MKNLMKLSMLGLALTVAAKSESAVAVKALRAHGSKLVTLAATHKLATAGVLVAGFLACDVVTHAGSRALTARKFAAQVREEQRKHKEALEARTKLQEQGLSAKSNPAAKKAKKDLKKQRKTLKVVESEKVAHIQKQAPFVSTLWTTRAVKSAQNGVVYAVSKIRRK